MDVPVAIPLQTGVKGASAAQTTAAAILAAKAARESKIWYHPGNLLKAFAKQVSGRYIVETYLVDRKERARALSPVRRSHPAHPRAQAIKEAYELTALTATLLLGAALQLFTTPTQMWDEWRTLAPNNLEFVGLTSGWVILNTLVCIMVCMGVLSIVRLVPEHDNTLRHLVLDRWRALRSRGPARPAAYAPPTAGSSSPRPSSCCTWPS